MINDSERRCLDMTNIPRMRTIPEAMRDIQKIDPNTAITVTALRRMVNNGEIPYVSVASKRLINLDILLALLQNADLKSVLTNI